MNSQEKNKYWNELISCILKCFQYLCTMTFCVNLKACSSLSTKCIYIPLETVSQLHFTVATIADICTGIPKCTTGLLNLKENVDALQEYMRLLASHLGNPLTVPLDELRAIPAHVKQEMKVNVRQELLEDPNKYISAYYFAVRIMPIVNDDFLLLILTIPLIDKSLQMNFSSFTCITSGFKIPVYLCFRRSVPGNFKAWLVNCSTYQAWYSYLLYHSGISLHNKSNPVLCWMHRMAQMGTFHSRLCIY